MAGKTKSESTSKRDRRLNRATRIAEMRFEHQLARKGRQYDPFRGQIISHRVKLNGDIAIDGSLPVH